MARYLVKYKLGPTYSERFLDLKFGDKYEAKDVLCSQNSMPIKLISDLTDSEKIHKNGTFICKCHFFCVPLQP